MAGCARSPGPLGVVAAPADRLAWRAAFESATRAPIAGGNAVQILLDGKAIYPAMLAAIGEARTSITFAQFIWKEGAISRLFAETLARRCRAGISAHILIDAWGARFMADDYVSLMRTAGCEVVDDYRPLTLRNLARANFRSHRRILVVDGRIGFTGGSGIGPRWLSDADASELWRETDVRVEGPVVRDLQAAFAAAWTEATGRDLTGSAYYPPLEPVGTADAQVVDSAPVFHDFGLKALFLLAFASARERIYLTNQYLVLEPEMAGALVDAARRGVDVVIIVPGAPTNWMVFAASRAGYGRLLEAGVRIHEYVAGPLHAKTLVVDSRLASIGSANIDPRSFRINDELNLVVHDEDVAREMEAIFARDLARSRPVTLEAWRARPLALRLRELAVRPIRGQL
jgi:cardiolipin synthase